MPSAPAIRDFTTADPGARNELIAAHLQRLEMTLARTQQAAASLRDLLQPPVGAVPVVIEHRRVPATPTAALTDVIDVRDANAWYQGAPGELHALLAAQKITPSGPGGAMVGRAGCSHARPRSKVSTSELYSARAAIPRPSSRPAPSACSHRSSRRRR
jgi:L-aminopeptidase/D-esterase-like protein